MYCHRCNKWSEDKIKRRFTSFSLIFFIVGLLLFPFGILLFPVCFLVMQKDKACSTCGQFYTRWIVWHYEEQ